MKIWNTIKTILSLALKYREKSECKIALSKEGRETEEEGKKMEELSSST